MIINSTCHVCYTNLIESPHKVCTGCLERLKKMYIHSNEYWKEYEKERALDSKQMTTEKKNIAFKVKSEINEWEELIKNGLSDLQVLSDLLDEVEPDLVWHHRRISFMKELSGHINIKHFKPATSKQVDDFKHQL